MIILWEDQSFRRDLLKNADIESSDFESEKNNIYISIEKLYLVGIKVYYQIGADQHGTYTERKTNYIFGTGSEIALSIIHYSNLSFCKYYDENGNETGSSCVSNIYFEPSPGHPDGSTNLFGKALYLNDDDIDKLEEWKFPKTMNPGTGADNVDTFKIMWKPNQGYNLMLVKFIDDSKPNCTEITYRTIENENSIDLELDSTGGQCCYVNADDAETAETLGIDTQCPTGEPSTYIASLSTTTCNTSNRLDFNTLSGCVGENGSATFQNCVFGNEKYNVGNGVYCYNNITVRTNNFSRNFSNIIKSGAIVPITNTATATVRTTCFSKNATAVETYVNDEKNYTLPKITLNFMNKSYSFTANQAKLPGIVNSAVKVNTEWGESVYKCQGTATIDYSYNHYLNQWIKISSYLGSEDKNLTSDGEGYINTRSLNLTVPVSTATGTYNSSVTLSKTGLINKVYALKGNWTSYYDASANSIGTCSIFRTSTSKLDKSNYNSYGTNNLISKMYTGTNSIVTSNDNGNNWCSGNGGTYYSKFKKCIVESRGLNLSTNTYINSMTTHTGSLYVLSGDIEGITRQACDQISKQSNAITQFTPDNPTVKVTHKVQSLSDDLTCEYPYQIENELTTDVCEDSSTQQTCTSNKGTWNNGKCDCTEVECNKNSPNWDANTGTCKATGELLNKLVFRPISLTNPFPGINGTGRSTNSNLWSQDNIKNFITNTANTIYTMKPLYSITLTPTIINQIRSYNNKHAYDDFTLDCSSNGTNCQSKFIRGNLSDFELNLLSNNSSCINIQQNFNSCLGDRNYR